MRQIASTKRYLHNMDRGMIAKKNLNKVMGKKSSSTEWLRRKASDPYTKLAHDQGFMARSAYKLNQILLENHDIRPSLVVDLGAAPGGWTQIVQKRFPKSHIICLDMKKMNQIPNTIQIMMDFTSDDAPKVLSEALAGKKVDLLLSDMAPSFSGQTSIDHLRLMFLAESAYEFSLYALKPGGSLIFKVNRGGKEAEFKKKLETKFDNVKFTKPDASYKNSSEIYIIAKKFLGKDRNEG